MSAVRRPRGVEALAIAPRPLMPALIGTKVRKPLADHVPAWLFWMQHALARSPSTIASYQFDARMFVAFCEQIGCVYPDEVTFQVVEGFGASLRAGLGQKETSISRKYSSMKRFFLFLKREGVVATNPVELALPMKVPPKAPPQYMTREEREKILGVLMRRRSRRGARNYAMTATMFLSGLRESEVCHLRVADVDLEAAMFYVHRGKGGKDRRVPITPRLVQILRSWITGWRVRSIGAAAPWLFLHTWRHHKYASEPLNPKAIWHMVHNTVVPILGRRVTPHTFRHSYATHLYEGSSDLNLVKALLGHESIRTTAMYAHVTPRKQRERLAEYLK